jgi:hypothetical protein
MMLLSYPKFPNRQLTGSSCKSHSSSRYRDVLNTEFLYLELLQLPANATSIPTFHGYPSRCQRLQSLEAFIAVSTYVLKLHYGSQRVEEQTAADLQRCG